MGMLDGKVAIVIGGHSGFGEAISHTFAREGAHVVVAARREALVNEVAAAVNGTGVRCDITDDDAVSAMVADVVDAHGTLDIAVNCAGYEQSTPIRDLTPDKLKAMHDVQLVGALYFLRHCCNAMADTGGGSFVSLSSLTAHNPAIGLTAYASAKAGLEYATQIAAVEYGKALVRVNAIAAGLIETPMTHHIFQSPIAVQAMIEITPLGFMGHPQHIADATLFLCGPHSSFITGQTLCVDGGSSLLSLPTPQMYADVAGRLAADLAAGVAHRPPAS